MKRWIVRAAIALLVFVGLGFPPANSLAAYSVAPHAGIAQDPKTITVYATRTGQKYHRDGCRYLSRSKIAMSLAEAAKRFDPCKVCKPAVLK